MKELPYHIRKISKNYYYDTIRDKYIPTIAIKSYIEDLKKPKVDADIEIRKLRWDLQID